MTRISPLLALMLLAAAGQAPAAAKPGSQAPARAKANLAILFTDRDYPAEAIVNREQGPVSFRLAIGPDGKPTACDVTVSSGSALLDSSTCRLLMERARFQPARDARGKPVGDSYAGRIVWSLPEDDLSSMEIAMTLWTACVGGEMVKLVPGDVPPAEVVSRSFAACVGLEAIAARRAQMSPPLTQLRTEMSPHIESSVVRLRAELATPPQPKGPSER